MREIFSTSKLLRSNERDTTKHGGQSTGCSCFLSPTANVYFECIRALSRNHFTVRSFNELKISMLVTVETCLQLFFFKFDV